ncbi:LamG domain-containing protein [Amnibacterium kyonggiense]|uniref:Concanavalin A-like lectin/glucanase superfamily protein n=1 Tax=Amnibacterium kyonggiense TaxID=595671 RepID=A0A4R7FPR4_9MICO|nr:LamG domain-containing protein [Amnibacterium kyonggiense]TDS79745.1 concanavalin A-like lectin/glucanase superfamily protein [Amnibacterium kyonggiense]
MRSLRAELRGRALGLGALAAAGLLGLALTAVPGASGGYSAKLTNGADTATTAKYFLCSDALAQDQASALFQWPLNDAAGSAGPADISGQGHTGAYQGTVTTNASTPISCPRDGGTAWTLDGATNYADYPVQQTNPQVFTVEIWFRTTVAGGKLIGFGANATGANTTYDRHVFLAANGSLVFGVYSGGAHTVSSPGPYNDGRWHYAAATLSSAGMALSVDGRSAVTGTTTVAENGSGYWRVGYDSISTTWSSPQTKTYFTGDLRYAAVYTTALTSSQIAAHWAAGVGS